MFIVSLIAKPGALEMSLVDSLRNAMGGGDAVWLSPDEAAEFPVQAVPENLDDIRESIKSFCDINVLSADNRRKRMLLADTWVPGTGRYP